jgi:hypothetical protein
MIWIQSRWSKVTHDVEGARPACGTPIEHGQMVLAAGGGRLQALPKRQAQKEIPRGSGRSSPGACPDSQ